MLPFNPVLLSVVGSNAWSHLHPVLVSIMGSNSYSHLDLYFCLLWGQIHGLIYTLYLWWNPWSHLHPVLVSVVGSNPWSHLHPVLVVSIVGYTCCMCLLWDQIHGPIYTLYLCLLWGQIHGPINTLYLSLFMVKSMVPFIPVLVSVVG